MSEAEIKAEPEIDFEGENEGSENQDMKLDSTVEYYGIDEEDLKDVDFSKCATLTSLFFYSNSYRYL